VAASLVKDFKIPVFAICGENRATYYKHIHAAIDHKPVITFDDGADLVSTLQAVLERARSRPVFEVDQEDISVPDMILYLKSLLRDRPRSEKLSIRELFERQGSRRAMICLFLAILEMVKLQAVTLVQKDAFGDIALKKHKGFDRFLASEEAMAAIEHGYR